MFTRLTRLLTGALATLALAAQTVPAANDGAAAPTAEVGQPAPGFTLADAAGTEHSLAELKGKVVALIWTNPGCPFIVRHYEAGSFNTLADQFKGQDVQVLLVDSSHGVTADSTKEAAEKYKVAVPVLLDAEGKTGKAYGAKTTPDVFVVDKEGKLVYSGAFDDDPQGQKDMAERTNYAAKAIESALAGSPVAEPTTKSYGCSVKYAKPEKKEARLAPLGDVLIPVGDGCCGPKKTTSTLTTAAYTPMGDGCCGKKTTETLTTAALAPLGGDCGSTHSTQLSFTLASLTPLGEGGCCKKTTSTLTTAALLPLGGDCGSTHSAQTQWTVARAY